MGRQKGMEPAAGGKPELTRPEWAKASQNQYGLQQKQGPPDRGCGFQWGGQPLLNHGPAEKAKGKGKKNTSPLFPPALTALASQQQKPASRQRARELCWYGHRVGWRRRWMFLERQVENIQLNTWAYAFSKLETWMPQRFKILTVWPICLSFTVWVPDGCQVAQLV